MGMKTAIRRSWYVDLPASLDALEQAIEAARSSYRRDTNTLTYEAGDWLTFRADDQYLILEYEYQGEVANASVRSA